MSPASIEPSLTQPSLSPPLSSSQDHHNSSSSSSSSTWESRFSNLRGVRWRICLQILPSFPSSTIEEHRRVAAESRRRYASLRRRLLLDPHLQKDGSRIPDPVMDNPLSQDPDSMWGRFFQNAELEKVLDQDLSRLYPEHESYLQTPSCQAMLRRILLLWCLKNPECGYRQGMHELLAPLVCVLHVDIQRLSEVRKKYENHFTDEFDGTSFPESDVVCNYRFTKAAHWDDLPNGTQDKPIKPSSLDELDPETRDTILLNDAYGAEGELGVLLSERFMEHDAYCMFDALMSGANGVVAMADFFSHSPASGSSTAPIIEASSALYHLLSLVDPSLHSHLVELGVEPQYFALRWLRVLFEREFPLKDLLLIWDEVFSYPNDASSADSENEIHPNFKILHSSRGAFISGMAVSMILHLKPALLATEHATSCLQKLLNFPQNTDLKKLIEKAQSLQALALDLNSSTARSGATHSRNKPQIVRGHTLSLSSISPKTPPHSLPESYWEQKWRVLHKEEENKETQNTSVSGGIIKGFQKARLSLSRTESDPSPSKSSGKTDLRSSIRRNLLDDFSRGSAPLVHGEESRSIHGVESKHIHGEDAKSGQLSSQSDHIASFGEAAVPNEYNERVVSENFMHSLDCKTEEPCLSGGASSVFSAESSLRSGADDGDNESEERSVTSHSYTGEIEEEACSSEAKTSCCNGPSAAGQEECASTSAAVSTYDSNKDPTHRPTTPKEKKPPGKFQWFWKFGRNSEGNSEKVTDIQKCLNPGDPNKDVLNPASDGCEISGKVEAGEKEVMSTMKNLGQLMLDNIQVLESIFQQERGQAGSLENLSNNIFRGKGQSTAMSALKELRNISSILLSEKGK